MIDSVHVPKCEWQIQAEKSQINEDTCITRHKWDQIKHGVRMGSGCELWLELNIQYPTLRVLQVWISLADVAQRRRNKRQGMI